MCDRSTKRDPINILISVSTRRKKTQENIPFFFTTWDNLMERVCRNMNLTNNCQWTLEVQSSFFSLLKNLGIEHEITKCEKQSERGNGGKDGERPLHPAGWGGLEG